MVYWPSILISTRGFPLRDRPTDFFQKKIFAYHTIRYFQPRRLRWWKPFFVKMSFSYSISPAKFFGQISKILNISRLRNIRNLKLCRQLDIFPLLSWNSDIGTWKSRHCDVIENFQASIRNQWTELYPITGSDPWFNREYGPYTQLWLKLFQDMKND